MQKRSLRRLSLWLSEMKEQVEKTMDKKDTVERISNRARMFLEAPGSHDWDHTLRVYNLALRIGKIEGAHLQVIKLAALLHDIARPIQDENKGKVCHAEEGGNIASAILQDKTGSCETSEKVTHCIRTHRFRKDEKPASLEAKVLFDADKLDSIGAIGIGRAFQFAGEVGARLHNKAIIPERSQEYGEEDTAYREFLVKLSKVKSRMLTDEGRRLAEARHEFMQTFFEQLNKEDEGTA